MSLMRGSSGPAVMFACVSVHLKTTCDLNLNVCSAIVSFTSFWKILAITTSEFHDQGLTMVLIGPLPMVLIGPADNDRAQAMRCVHQS